MNVFGFQSVSKNMAGSKKNIWYSFLPADQPALPAYLPTCSQTRGILFAQNAHINCRKTTKLFPLDILDTTI